MFSLLLIVISCKSQEGFLTDEEAKKICDKVETMYNKVDIHIANEILDSAYVLYSPFFPIGARGIDVLMYNIESNARSFPDFKLTIDSFFVKDNVIYSYWTQKGTNTGPLGRMPTTGKSTDVSGFAISRVRNGKIYEEHTYWNVLELYKQLGFQIVPPKFEEE
jgi:steroid delta-isomerase-like uncharacterized protein